MHPRNPKLIFLGIAAAGALALPAVGSAHPATACVNADGTATLTSSNTYTRPDGIVATVEVVTRNLTSGEVTVRWSDGWITVVKAPPPCAVPTPTPEPPTQSTPPAPEIDLPPVVVPPAKPPVHRTPPLKVRKSVKVVTRVGCLYRTDGSVAPGREVRRITVTWTRGGKVVKTKSVLRTRIVTCQPITRVALG